MGSITGPLLGSLLYSFFGFLNMFLIFGLVHMIFIPLFKCELPANIDDNDEATASLIQNQDKESYRRQKVSFAPESSFAPGSSFAPESSFAPQTSMAFDSSRSQEARNEPEVSYYELYKDPMITLITVTEVVLSIAFSYVEPVLSFRLLEFTESVRLQGLIFVCLAIGYCAMSFFVPYISNCMNLVRLVNISILLCGISNFLVGPAMFLPNNVFIVAAGLFFTGVTVVSMLIPMFPIMLKR